MNQPAPSIRLQGPWEKTAGWARVLEDGRIELELYDFSDKAQATFGNDVAWMYSIEASEKPRIIEALSRLAGAASLDPEATDDALLHALAENFSDVLAIREWLKKESIPFQVVFDSWA